MTDRPANWYPDPMRNGAGWRWWDGHAWTTFTELNVGHAPAAGAGVRRPRLPRWLSVPVVVCAPLVAIGVVVLAFVQPLAVVAGLVPLAIVLPVISWLDRVEPEPRSARVHALLWGAGVAVLGAITVNTLVGVVAGEVAAMVVSAPIVEEGLKALGVVWMVRRGEIDGVSDGIVYAGWVALGFAVVEDMSYFALASVEGSFVPVFALRALLTPFAHPLFTFWTGLAVGRAVWAGKPVMPHALWGYAVAVATHMLWNGSLSIGQIRSDIDEEVAGGVVLAVGGVFVLLFVAVVVAVVRLRNIERDRFMAVVPQLILRHNLPPDEAQAFASWGSILAARRRLPRQARRDFDAVHAALVRLGMHYQRSASNSPSDTARTTERVLVESLHAARRRIR